MQNPTARPKPIPRTKAKVLTTAAVLVGALSLLSTQMSRATDDESRVTLDSRIGTVAGISGQGVKQFRGIRYAKPPTGDRRFMAPVAAGHLGSGTYDATKFSNRCPQPAGGLGAEGGANDEDCLFLNITTPASNGKDRPVLFWIHGGAFTQGSANDYDASVLARQGDVVVVTINYRLGLLGFADLSSLGEDFVGSAGNGFRDQILALEWVRDSISDYGGDPDNVTIFGESAGGHSVHSLLASPSADGLYHKAIAHSPGTANLPAQDQVPAISAQLGLADDALLDKLRSMSDNEMLQLQGAVDTNGGRIDGTVVTRSTNDAIIARGAAGVPLIAGTNHDEGTLFTMLIPPPMWGLLGNGLARSITSGSDPAAYLQALKSNYPEDSDKQNHERIWVDMFRHSAIGSTQRATQAGPGGWLYRFDLPSTVPMGGQELGATHAAEIAFTFNSFAGGSAPLNLYDADDPVAKDLAQRWSSTIIAFAKTGDPNGAGLPTWSRYSATNRQTLVLDANPRIETNLDKTQMKLWDSVGITP
jgi:para-nitrobenzyl esterase